MQFFSEEKAQMEAAGFEWDPAHRMAGSYARWSHFASGVTALRQPYMNDQQWDERRAEAIAEVQALGR